MFREMRRKNQQISDDACKNILIHEPRGILSMIGDDGYPYGIPLSYWYCEENGHIYFHGAGEGHKMDAIRACDKVSFCVMDQGYRKEGEWSLNINSIIVFGRIRVVEQTDEKVRACATMCKKFTDDQEYMNREFKNAFSRVTVLELIPEHITGKLVNES